MRGTPRPRGKNVGRATSFLAVILGACLLTGCAGILSPYKSEYSCKKAINGNGKCLDLDESYELSGTVKHTGLIKQDEQDYLAIKGKISRGRKLSKDESERLQRYMDKLKTQVDSLRETPLEKAKRDEVLGILRQANKPIRSTEKVLRVLILPYVNSEGELNEHRYTYFTVDQGEWVVGEYLYPKGQNALNVQSTISPLSSDTEVEERDKSLSVKEEPLPTVPPPIPQGAAPSASSTPIGVQPSQLPPALRKDDKGNIIPPPAPMVQGAAYQGDPNQPDMCPDCPPASLPAGNPNLAPSDYASPAEVLQKLEKKPAGEKPSVAEEDDLDIE